MVDFFGISEASINRYDFEDSQVGSMFLLTTRLSNAWVPMSWRSLFLKQCSAMAPSFGTFMSSSLREVLQVFGFCEKRLFCV